MLDRFDSININFSFQASFSCLLNNAVWEQYFEKIVYEPSAFLTSNSNTSVAGPPQRVLSNFLHSFLHSSHGGIPFRPTSLPVLGLSEGDKRCIRDRSSIMARHLFADKSEDFIHAQVLFICLKLQLVQ